MKVPCSVIKDLLPLYHDSVCSPESAALVEEHLRECESCQEEFHRLETALLPPAASEKEGKKANSIKKVKKTLRRKRLAVAAITLAVIIAVSIPVGMWMSIPCFTLPLNEVSITITEKDGILDIYSESLYGVSVSRVFYPDGTSREPSNRQNGSALILSAEYTPLTALKTWLQGEQTEITLASPTFNFQWPLTEEGWWEDHKESLSYVEAMEGIQKTMQKELPDYQWNDLPYDYDSSIPRTPGTDEDFLYRNVKEVYYYTGINTGIWRKDNDELLADLEKHGTLLWTVEDGVVYQP